MRDVLMIALMIASILVFAAYVAFCDRIVGLAEPGADDAAHDAPGRAGRRAGAGGVMLAISFDNLAGLVLALAAIVYLIVVLIRPERF